MRPATANQTLFRFTQNLLFRKSRHRSSPDSDRRTCRSLLVWSHPPGSVRPGKLLCSAYRPSSVVAASLAALTDFPLFGFQLPELASFQRKTCFGFAVSSAEQCRCQTVSSAARQLPRPRECYRGLSGSIPHTPDRNWWLTSSREIVL